MHVAVLMHILVGFPLRGFSSGHLSLNAALTGRGHAPHDPGDPAA